MKLHEVLSHHEFSNSSVDFNNQKQLIVLLQKKMKAVLELLHLKGHRLDIAKKNQNLELISKLDGERRALGFKYSHLNALRNNVVDGTAQEHDLKKVFTEASETVHKHILWVDDLRHPPASIEQNCDIARTSDAAVSMLSKYQYTDIYLDHDLGDFSGPGGSERNGYHVVLFLADLKNDGKYVPLNFHILTDNPVGRRNIEGVINRYLRS